MIIIKLVLILLLLLILSKCFGLIINKKYNITYETSLGLGYISNIAIFSISIFIPAFLKLSTKFMMIFGFLYLLISLIAIIYVIKNKIKIFKFSKREILSLLFGLIFTLLFLLFVDFGHADMYDSYFYNILTNSASNASHLSMINPYNGIGDLQNFYKYILYYYQASFFANLFAIKPAYLVLIWPFTYMVYYFISITALGIVRISKKDYINNIISIFVLTLFTHFFRAPFNALYMVNLLIPIYMLSFISNCYNKKGNEDNNIKIYYILFIAAASCSSAILYTSATCLCVWFIASCLKKETDNFDIIFKLSIPTYILGIVYITESTRNIYIYILAFIIILLIKYLLTLKFVNKILKQFGRLLLFLILTLFILTPKLKGINNYTYMFFKQGTVPDKMATVNSSFCIPDIIKVNSLDFEIDYSKFGTAMTYIYKNPTSLLNTFMISITHSIFMYGGLLFLLIYGFIKHRKDINYIAFIVYLILFFNPLVSKGLATLTLDLNGRIYLYFNTYFAIIGIKYFFEFVQSLKNQIINTVLKYAYIPYIVLLCISVISYIQLLKWPDFNNTNLLYKVPNNLVKANEEVNNIVSKNNTKNKPIVLYTLDVLNLSMIDSNPNNKYKTINSKEYKSYYFNPKIINDKMLINIFFESNGIATFDNIKDDINKKYYDKINYDICDINKELESYNIKYIVLSKSKEDSYKQIMDSYKIIYDKNDIIVIERNDING